MALHDKPQPDITVQFEYFAKSLPGFVYQLIIRPDETTEYLYVSENSEALFGVPASEVRANSRLLLDMIHPDDYDWVMESTRIASEKGEPWDCEFRMVRPDGQVIWVECHDVPESVDSGGYLYTGYAIDITKRKATEAALKESERRFRTLVESANDIIYTLDKEGVLTYVSPNWTQILGHEVDAVVGKTVADFVHPEDVDKCFAALGSITETGDRVSGVEYRILHLDGKYRWHVSNASALRNESGKIDGFMGIARDINSRKETELELKKLAHYDLLTNLPNRVLFYDLLEKAINSALRRNGCLALMFVDLDKFKPVNDRFGHSAGDSVLIEVARRLQMTLRSSDVAGRFGGDEFVVLLPDMDKSVTPMADAIAVANKLREVLSEPFNYGKNRFEISASIGVALYPDHGYDAITLSRAADDAMYLSKQNGKNCVTVCSVPAAVDLTAEKNTNN